jgi:maltooligosyltrehalose trehalohydrolase
MLGERLTQIVSFEGLKLAAGIVLLSPFIPLIFMGEEYGEVAPFLYFTSHSDPALIDAVREGRRQEFASFRWQGEPPDPQKETTFLRTKLNHRLSNEGQHQVLLQFYKKLIRLRREVPALSC